MRVLPLPMELPAWWCQRSTCAVPKRLCLGISVRSPGPCVAFTCFPRIHRCTPHHSLSRASEHTFIYPRLVALRIRQSFAHILIPAYIQLAPLKLTTYNPSGSTHTHTVTMSLKNGNDARIIAKTLAHHPPNHHHRRTPLLGSL